MRRPARIALVLSLVAGTLLLAGCAPGVNDAVGSAPPGAETPAGFWLGLWHGVIVVVTFVISLFNDNVSVYEVHNTGGWYDAGFLLGLTISLGGSGAGARRGSR